MLDIDIVCSSTFSIPRKGSAGAAGYDVMSSIKVTIEPGKIEKIPLGFSLSIPSGYVGVLCPRSSFGAKGITTPNSVGIIDSDYRGEVALLLQNESPNKKPFEINPGDRVGQIIFIKYEDVVFNRVSILSKTKRGNGGFGSTGV